MLRFQFLLKEIQYFVRATKFYVYSDLHFPIWHALRLQKGRFRCPSLAGHMVFWSKWQWEIVISLVFFMVCCENGLCSPPDTSPWRRDVSHKKMKIWHRPHWTTVFWRGRGLWEFDIFNWESVFLTNLRGPWDVRTNVFRDAPQPSNGGPALQWIPGFRVCT